MNVRRMCFGALTIFACCCVATRADSSFTPRNVVYSFTYGSQTDLEVHSSGIDPGGGASGSSGMTDFTGGVGDRGTIDVAVLSQQPDGGVVLKVSEHAQKTRSAPAATCVVYGTTGAICDPQATLRPEEMSVIRFFGSNFVDPNKLDAKHHWQITDADSDYSLTSDFTVSSNTNGVMTIDETRTIKQQHPSISTTAIATRIGYDATRGLPTSVREYATERSEAGMGQHNTVTTQTILMLQSDAPATKT